MKRSKSEFERDAQVLVGKSLKSVRYFEIQYGINNPSYLNDSFRGHLLDYGCDLEMSDGSIFGFIWDNEYFPYGVGVTPASIGYQLTNTAVWDVTDDAYWVGLVGKTIREVKVYWSWIQHEGNAERLQYPQDISVEFSNGVIVLFSSSQYDTKNDKLMGMSDDIAVIFEDDVARKYNIGVYSN